MSRSWRNLRLPHRKTCYMQILSRSTPPLNVDTEEAVLTEFPFLGGSWARSTWHKGRPWRNPLPKQPICLHNVEFFLARDPHSLFFACWYFPPSCDISFMKEEMGAFFLWYPFFINRRCLFFPVLLPFFFLGKVRPPYYHPNESLGGKDISPSTAMIGETLVGWSPQPSMWNSAKTNLFFN